MRLFITKQSCNRLVVSGYITDDDAHDLDLAEDDGMDIYSGVMIDLEDDRKLLRSISDCDSWDGTAEELIKEFSDDIVRWKEYKNSNEKFRYDRAMLAVHYLERI